MSQTPHQPKIVQGRLLRTAVVLFVGAGAVGGYLWYSHQSKSDTAPVDTKGCILALRNDAHASRAVLIKPDGSIVEAPTDQEGTDDREAVWRPDGSRVFISRSATGSKDPELSTYHLYRWKPDERRVERRTIGSRALAHPRFAAADAALPDPMALATAGGRVLLFDPLQDSSIKQILPPTTKEIAMNANAQGEADAADFDALYKGLGSSFREARWSSDKSYIVAVLRRDSGEALIMQLSEPKTDADRVPRLIVCGDHIDFDVLPTGNAIVFTVQGFQWEDAAHVPDKFKKNGKIETPYRHLFALVDLDKANAKDNTAIAAIDVSNNDAKCFSEPVCSPDGGGVAVVVGGYKGVGDFQAEALMAYALQGGSPIVIAPGAISNPCWEPSSEGIVYAKKGADGHHDICFMARGGGQERQITSGKGDFTHPVYSPQKAASAAP